MKESVRSGEGRAALWFVLPALLVVVVIAIFPLAYTIFDSFHLHDLRMPWRGHPFVGFSNYEEALRSARFWGAVEHTLFFTVSSVLLELGLGMALAMLLDRVFFGRGAVRTASLLPWALPTVVAALLFRFLFDPAAGVAGVALQAVGLGPRSFSWLSDPVAAWVPVILTDVWKTTPFVALLLLAGLQNIPEATYEAARIDGAGPVSRFFHVTLPLLRPALLVVLVFRSLDAFRVFDLVYVLTGGGPGTATEPVALYTFKALLQDLRFGYGSALSVIVFLVTAGLAAFYVRLLGAGVTRDAA